MARPRRSSRVSVSTRAALASKEEPPAEEPFNDDDDDDDDDNNNEKKNIVSNRESARKRQRGLSDDEIEDDNDDGSEDEATPVTPKQRTKASQSDDDENKKTLFNPEESEEEEESSPKKPGRSRTSELKAKSRGPKTNRTCPHCEKLCSTAHGLRYHLEHNVCRKVKKPHPATLGRPCAGPVGTETSTDRRTCNHCHKLSASVSGLKYHVAHRVCFKESYGMTNSLDASDSNKEETDSEDDEDDEGQDNPAPEASKGKIKDDAHDDDSEEATPPDLIKTKHKDAQVNDEDKARSDASEGNTEDDDDRQEDNENTLDTTEGGVKDDDIEADNEAISKDATDLEPTERKDKDDNGGDASSIEDNDDESFNEEDAKEDRRAARLRNRAKQPKSAKKSGRGLETARTCPHCAKICCTPYGLKYHLDNMVCRKEKKAGENKLIKGKKSTSTPKKRGRGRSSIQPSARNKRFRGRKEDRTCPDCKKLFTSALGRDYHVKHQVCKDQAENVAGSLAFPTLKMGSKFVTRYGIVEVVADDRVTPTYKYPADIKVVIKTFTSHRDKQAVARRRVQIAFAFQSRLRRRRLKRAYDFNHINPDTTRKAYFGGSALAREAIARDVSVDPLAIAHRRDPFCPPEAFPDRIVVCKPIPDQRPTFYSLNQEEGIVRGAPPFASNLYLRRREFNKPYSTELSIYICQDCGQDFNSREGYAYHYQSKVCFNRSKSRGAQRAEMNEAAQVRLERYVKRSSTKMQKKRKAEVAVYPQVWLSLGFTVIEYKKVQGLKGDEIFVEKRVKDVDETLNKLRELVKQEAMRNNNEKLGAMYPQVFKALGFEKPRKRKRSKGEQGPKKRRRRRKEGDEAEDEMDTERLVPPTIPPPQILDMHVLIDEAKSGRYPSIKRYTGDYADVCVICKDGGKLLLCDFCKNTVHLTCLLTRVAFKELDPEEDFLCHSCARKIVSRRNRAEKRRLLKQQTVLDNARQKAADAAVDDTEQSDYHVTAAVGKELSELLELLEDSRHRLHHIVEAARLNNFRRAKLP